MPKTATAIRRTFFCQICDHKYGDCEHSNDHQTLPKEETGRIISAMEYIVLLDAGEF